MKTHYQTNNKQTYIILILLLISVIIIPTNAFAITAVDDSYSTAKDTTLYISKSNILSNDQGSGLSIQNFDSKGSIGGSITDYNSTHIKYTPPSYFHYCESRDTFYYTLTDGSSIDTAKITIDSTVTSCDSHNLRFFFHTDVNITNEIYARKQLAKYVHDMNYLYNKNTQDRLIFDSDNPSSYWFKVQSSQPHNNILSGTTTGYEIWTWYTDSTSQYSCCASAGGDSSGAGVVDGNWTDIYDPDTLTPTTDPMKDYAIQLDQLMHEMGHIAGCCIGEIYNQATVNDETGVSPTVNINLSNYPNDIFWTAEKSDWVVDDMLGLCYGNGRCGNPTSRSALLNVVKFSDLNAAVFNGNHRIGTCNWIPQPVNTPCPTDQALDIRIHVINNQTAANITDADIKIWRIRTNDDTAFSLYNGTSDSNGNYVFDWAGFGSQHSNQNGLHLIKVYKTGFTDTVKYITVFDGEEDNLVNQNAEWVVTIRMEPT